MASWYSGSRTTRRLGCPRPWPETVSAAVWAASAWGFVLSCLLSSVGIELAHAEGFRTRIRLQMGSLTEITVPEPTYQADQVNRAFAVVDRLDRLLSTYKADSEVSLLADLGRLQVSAETLAITRRAVEMAHLTNGAFNPLLGPVIALWREAQEQDRLPQAAALEQARRLADYEQIAWDESSREIRLGQPGMGLNFGAIGKGYAVDLAAASLAADGVQTALVSAGTSSHRLLGWLKGKAGTPRCWEIGVRHPGDEARAALVLRLAPGAMATSAQSGQPIIIDGQTYGHIIDARTGRPATPTEAVLSATVLAAEATTADALATALIVMEASQGLALIESLPGVEAVLMRESRGSDNRTRGTPRLEFTSGLQRTGTLESLPVITQRAVPKCLDSGDAQTNTPPEPVLSLDAPNLAH